MSAIAVFLLVLLVAVLTAADTSVLPSKSIQTHLHDAEARLFGLNFKRYEALAYQSMQLVLTPGSLPLDLLLPVEITSRCIDVHLHSESVIQRERRAVDGWTDTELRQAIESHLNDSRVYYARLQIQEALQDVDAIREAYLSTRRHHDSLVSVLNRIREPSRSSGVLFSIFHRLAPVVSQLVRRLLLLGTTGWFNADGGPLRFVLTLAWAAVRVLLLLLFQVLAVRALWNRRSAPRGYGFWAFALLSAVLTCLTVVSTEELLSRGSYLYVATSQPAGIGRLEQLLAHHGSLFLLTYGSELDAVRAHLTWIEECLAAMDAFNQTVMIQIVEFTRRAALVATPVNDGDAESLYDPTASLYIVQTAQTQLSDRRHAIVQLAHRYDSQALATPEVRQKLHRLGDYLDAFTAFFNRIEAELFSYLNIGMQINQFFLTDLSSFVDYVRDGRLDLCVHILTELEAAQIKQLVGLNSSCQFLGKASHAVKLVRREAQELEKPLDREQYDAWFNKLVVKSSSVAGGLTMSAVYLLPGVANPVTLPVTATSMVLALMAYNWGGSHYDVKEREFTRALDELTQLGDVLLQLDTGLMRHRQTLSMLMEDVRGLILAVTKAEARFAHVRVKPQFSPPELRLLSEGIDRVRESIKDVNARYRAAMDSIFNRVQTRLQQQQQQQQQQQPQSLPAAS